MIDDRAYTTDYYLYRASVVSSDTGEQSVEYVAVAPPNGITFTCIFYPVGETPFRIGPEGIDVDADAVMLVPHSRTIYAEHKGQQPDRVRIDDTDYIVRKVYDAGGRGMFKVVTLEERR